MERAGQQTDLSQGQAGWYPWSDWELKKIKQQDLEPFYRSTAGKAPRHRIGGARALSLEQQLIQVGRSNETVSKHMSVPLEPWRFWGVYPEGLSPYMLERLDQDAWPEGKVPTDVRCRADRWPKECARRERAWRLRHIPPPRPPPRNTARRSEVRDAAIAATGSSTEAAEAAIEPHLLLVNPPQTPMPRQRGRHRNASGPSDLAAPHGGQVTDPSWPEAATFHWSPKQPKRCRAAGVLALPPPTPTPGGAPRPHSSPAWVPEPARCCPSRLRPDDQPPTKSHPECVSASTRTPSSRNSAGSACSPSQPWQTQRCGRSSR